MHGSHRPRPDRVSRLAALTFDIDWAPDWCVEQCLRFCKELSIPATFFVTHESPVLAKLHREDQIEVGIHPNFLPNSTQGNSVEKVMAFCLALAPRARAMRTHALVQSTPLLIDTIAYAPQIDTDVSLYLADQGGLKPMDLYFENGSSLTRLPYIWEDDLQSMKPGYDWSPVVAPNGLCIYNVHPIHFALDMCEMGQYRAFTNSLNGKSLREADEEEVEPYVNRSGRGVIDCMRDTVAAIGPKNFRTVSEITQCHRSGEAR